MRQRTLFFMLAALFVHGAGAPAAETVRCETTRDVWLSAYKEEADHNMGAAPRIKLKFWQEFGIVDFDVSTLRGKTIGEAYLYMKPTGGSKLGMPGGSDLEWITVSTVSHDWVEGQCVRGAPDTKGFGATFNESSCTKRNWGWPGAKCWDVILGNGNTLRFDGRVVPENGWLKMRIDPRLVRALAAGASYGLLIMDGSTTHYSNSYVSSRESGHGPYLEVIVAGADGTPPAPPEQVEVSPAPNRAGPSHGAAAARFRAPRDAFAYRVKVNGREAPRWAIPFAARPGEIQTVELLDLESEGRLHVEVAAVDAAGNCSPFVSASGRASSKLIVPRLPASDFHPRPGDPKPLGGARVWALPEITKVDPVTGLIIEEQGASGFRRANPVWDGRSGAIRLAAARGEIISFQVVVEGRVTGCRIAVSPLSGPGRISNRGVRLWRNWCVGRQPEYALPLEGGVFDCPAPDNKIPGQKLQAITVDYHIPRDAAPGPYQGGVAVAAQGERVVLPLRVKVYDVAIPDEAHFNPELNCYGGPGEAGSDKFKESFRLAHYHRCTINRVPYSQNGRVKSDWAPEVNEKGRVTDWSGFDRRLGGLLDGSWFEENPRRGVPVPTLYLPLFEGWPLNFRDHYHPGPGVPLRVVMEDGGRKIDPMKKLLHDHLAPPIEQAIDREFQDAFVACASDFARHFRDKGWNRTIAEFYLNNKPGYGYTLWTLDEPAQYLDWAALNFFGRLFNAGVDDPEVHTLSWHEQLFREGLEGMRRDRGTLLFRGDISRPMWQGSCSDGIMSIIYANSRQFEMRRGMANLKRRCPAILYCYGSCNAVDRSNWESAAWCLKAYAHECDGVLPWQSLAGEGALRRADTNGLIIDAGRYGAAVASLRVHALRRGAQDCELLRLLQLQRGWSRAHIGLLVSQKVPLTASLQQNFADAASAVTFGTLTSRGFCELKEGVLKLLTQQ